MKKFIKECDHCQRKPLTEIASIPLIPSEVESAPFYEIGLDLVGPLEATKNGEFIYIIIKEEKSAYIKLVDLFIKMSLTLDLFIRCLADTFY